MANHGWTSSLVSLLHRRMGGGCLHPLPPASEHSCEPRFSLVLFLTLLWVFTVRAVSGDSKLPAAIA